MAGGGTNRGAPATYPDPRYAALVGEANAAIRAGDHAAAERAARVLVQANPREHFAWHVLAIAALRRGQPEAAADAAKRAHELDRKNADYLNTLGVACADLGRGEEALAALRRALKLRPAFADAHYNAGKVHERNERLHEAKDAYQRAVLIEPANPAARHNLARVLRRLGDGTGALALARELHAERPEELDRMLGLAFALADARGLQQGARFLAQCLERWPEYADLHGELAGMLFALEDWAPAWREYLWRPLATRSSGKFPAPLPDDLAGSAVVLLPDQGLGDMLFFLRFVVEVRARSGMAVFAPPAKLAPLLAGHPDLDHVVSSAALLPSGTTLTGPVLFGDLPYVLGVRTVAPPFPLRPRDDLVSGWRERLTGLGPSPYIGVTWRAGTDLRASSTFVDRQPSLSKEIPLERLAAVVKEGAGTVISVQRLPTAGETQRFAALAGRPVHDLSGANDDLEAGTALLAALDEYVGVSNTNMHLRAGIGGAARVLVPYPGEWRWAGPGDRSPWFPGFGVYRQRADGGWDESLARLAADLRERFSGRRA